MKKAMVRSSSYKPQYYRGTHTRGSEKEQQENFFFNKRSMFSVNSNRNKTFFQAKLSVGQPDDKYEREADRVADKVVNQKNSGPVIQQKEISSVQRLATSAEEEKLGTNDARMLKDKEIQEKPDVQRKCAECEKEEMGVQKKADPLEKDEEMLQTKSEGASSASSLLSNQISHSSGKGKSLPSKTLRHMNSSFGVDFSSVNIHTDESSAKMNKELGAQAFTHGSDIYFNRGKYNPESSTGKYLLAHELTHVIQQKAVGPTIQRDVAKGPERKKTKINYKRAEKLNKAHAKPNSLGWESKLETIAGGKFKAWSELWSKGRYDEFADAVAQHQVDEGTPVKLVTGVLDLKTWSKIGGYGEAMAGLESVLGEKAKEVCTLATLERVNRGHKLATGTKFKLPKGVSGKMFNWIFQTIEGRMADVDEIYRATGAAGAMVYAGKATFVNEADIWKGGLLPGAPMQVWGSRDGYDILRKGVIEYKVRGKTKTRRIKPSDGNFFGTSFVFVRYDNPDNPTKMLVRHFSGEEWHKPSDYQVWIGANIN